MKKFYTPAFLFILLSTVGQNLFGQQPAERLTGYRFNQFNSNTQMLELNDSLRFVYSAGRGSTDIENFVFDTKTEVTTAGNYQMVVSQFDSHSNVIQAGIKEWFNGNWVDQGKELFTYNSSNHVTEQVIQQYYNNSFMNFFKITFGYDAHGDTVQMKQFGADTSGIFILANQVDYEFDNQYRHTKQASYNIINGVVADTNEVTYYTYDINGDMVATHSDLADSTHLTAPWRKSEYAYDSPHVIQSAEDYSYVGGTWEPEVRRVYYYTPGGLLSKERDFSSDHVGGLLPWQQYVCSYNSNNLIDTSWWQEYSDLIFDFKSYSRNVFTYDSANLLTSNERQDIDTGGNWNNNTKYEYEYDAAHNRTRFVSSYYSGGMYNESFEQWYLYETYVPVTITGITKTAEAGISIYPNPAHDNVTIDIEPAIFSSLKLVNLTGQVILSQQINENASRVSLNSAFLQSGVYLIELNAGDHIVSKKIIIE